MITTTKLYEQTNKGLDIILYYYPQARECTDGKKKFKARPGEHTASAVICLPTQKRDYYCVCDFGDDGHALSPLDIAMKEEGINRFYEAVLKVAARHNVTDELDKSINVPRFETRAAQPGEKDGDRPFRLLKRIPQDHLTIFGPNVTHEHTEFLHWHEAEYIGYVKDGKVSLRYSTEHYPIFMRECITDEGKKFYKIYEPLNTDKGRRFTYTPAGIKPKKFINGFRELEVAIELLNKDVDPDDRGRVTKIPEAYICSGERDAICCLSMGGHPLWFNSETYDLSPEEYNAIMEKVEVLYNIPDIDSTGRKKGTQLALRYMDIKTMWLPDELASFRDNRGKPRKDLRDWMEIYSSKSDFNSLKNLALPAKFWVTASNEKTGKKEYALSALRLYYFLQLQGFYSLYDEDSDACRFVRIEGNVVKALRTRDVKRFVTKWAEKSALTEKVRNLIVSSMKFSDSSLENLKEIELDFTDFTPTTQTLFFQNCTIEVSGSDIIQYKRGDSVYERYVWKENVIPHRVRILDDFFRVERDGEAFRLEVLNSDDSPFFGYVINSSRLYWRKEMETRFIEDGETPEALQRMRDYAYFHKYCIDGDGLSEEEIDEQKLCLLNKIFTIGYLLHHHKSPSRPWAPFAMDNKIGEQGECNGRSGKSFMFKTLSMFMKSDTLSGRNKSLMDNPHVFERVTKDTNMVLVDDCAQTLQLGMFYDAITSDLIVNPKNNRSFTIPFAYSPKFVFSSNYVPTDFDASSVARSLYVVFSDYYHEKTDLNGYRESRRISDDYGGDLYSESYTEDQWNADINFILQCLRFYLSVASSGVKIMPPMDTIMKRKQLQDMGDNFQDWAEVFFAQGGPNVNTFVVRKVAFEDFRLHSNSTRHTMKSFTKRLKAFCEVTPYITALNPPELCGPNGRILHKVNKILEEMIYIRAEEEKPEEPTPEPSFFDEEDDDGDCPY